ncbi:MAG: hypothetical protein NVS3B20_20950 [Polyangiales bacterium]
MSFLVRAGLALALLLAPVGCSSPDFSVTANDASTSDVPRPSDAADPCPDIPGASRFCVTIKTEGSHPGYDSTSTGASALKIDGKGTLYVRLFDKDPAIIAGTPPAPVTTLQYPPDGTEIDIDAAFPVTIAGTVATGPGSYWVLATFQDNHEDARGLGQASILAGDFVQLPTVDSNKKASFPTVQIVAGTTAKKSVTLSAYYRVDVKFQTSFQLQKDAKDNPLIHGDGPIVYAVYDGGDIFSPGATVLSVDVGRCTNVFPSAIPPPPIAGSFRTTANGMHSIAALLLDYDVYTDGPPNPFPGRGTIFGTTMNGTLDVSTSSWVSFATIIFQRVHKPYSLMDPMVIEKFICR